MTIHHAIIKQAEEFGVIMTEVEGEEGRMLAKAHWPKLDKVFLHNDPKIARDAALVCITLCNEWPAVALEQAEDMTFNLVHNGEVILDNVDVTDKIGLLADMNDRCYELEIDPEVGIVDVRTGTVVKAKYKEAYADAGHPNDCGDNLAEYCREMALEEFIAMCAENNVTPSAKVQGVMEAKNRGWQGRVRMSMGNALRKVVKEQGHLIHLRKEIKVKL